eukprot:3098220-Pleurochrysis_carterae.AAC.1
MGTYWLVVEKYQDKVREKPGLRDTHTGLLESLEKQVKDESLLLMELSGLEVNQASHTSGAATSRE